jgi:hypothetical protein
VGGEACHGCCGCCSTSYVSRSAGECVCACACGLSVWRKAVWLHGAARRLATGGDRQPGPATGAPLSVCAVTLCLGNSVIRACTTARSLGAGARATAVLWQSAIFGSPQITGAEFIPFAMLCLTNELWRP